MVNRLSLSFYAEDTLKMNKQVILDDCQEVGSIFEDVVPVVKPASCSKNKISKPKTPVIRFQKTKTTSTNQSEMHKSLKVPEPEDHKKPISKQKERSSSKSSRGKKTNTQLLDYLSNRIDISGKSWNGLRPLLKSKTSQHKKV